MVETDNIDSQLADERASDWVDALMDQREREAFERELADDPALAAELESFEQTVRVLRRMPQPSAPDDFLQAVQSRIRRRSRGRWFGFEQARGRFPYEAAFNIVLIGILCALYLSATTAGPDTLVKPKFDADPVATLGALIPTADVVEGPKRVDGTAGTDGSVLRVVVKASALVSVKATLASNSGFEVTHTDTAGPVATLLVRVIPQRGPPAR